MRCLAGRARLGAARRAIRGRRERRVAAAAAAAARDEHPLAERRQVRQRDQVAVAVCSYDDRAGRHFEDQVGAVAARCSSSPGRAGRARP